MIVPITEIRQAIERLEAERTASRKYEDNQPNLTAFYMSSTCSYMSYMSSFLLLVHALIAKDLTVLQTVSPHQPHLQIMIRIVRLHNMTLCM